MFLDRLQILIAAFALGIAAIPAQAATPFAAASANAEAPPLLVLQSKAVKDGGTMRVIVLLRDGVGVPADGASDAAVAVASHRAQDLVASRALGSSGRILSRTDFVPMFVARVTPAEMARLAADPSVAGVSEDIELRPLLRDSLPIIGMTGARGAYAKGANGAGRAVAVLDTGANKSNEFMRGKVISEACYNTNDSGQALSSRCPGGATSSIKAGSGADCAQGIEGCGHGTHVSGIAAGKNPSVIASEPVNGVAPAAGIVAINVFSKRTDIKRDQGKRAESVTALTSDIIKGLERVYALRNGVANRRIDAVNMSLGAAGGFADFCDSVYPPITKVINKLRSAGIAVVIASGNGSIVNGTSFPSCIKGATTVGSTTKRATGKPEKIAFYSNSGPQVDVLAPGGEIGYPFPSGNRGGIQSSMFNGYANLQGTSMAAPHVAGVFAAIRSAKGCGSKPVSAIEDALKKTGTIVQDKRGPCSFCLQLKRPRVNVSAALSTLKCGK